MYTVSLYPAAKRIRNFAVGWLSSSLGRSSTSGTGGVVVSDVGNEPGSDPVRAWDGLPRRRPSPSNGFRTLGGGT